jgi:hypothetical protein
MLDKQHEQELAENQNEYERYQKACAFYIILGLVGTVLGLLGGLAGGDDSLWWALFVLSFVWLVSGLGVSWITHMYFNRWNPFKIEHRARQRQQQRYYERWG